MSAACHSETWWSRLAPGVVALLVSTWSTTPVGAANPGDLYEWTVPGSQPVVTLRFRFCPSGSIEPGRPAPIRTTTSDSVGTHAVKLREFYIGETEVTLDQFRAVLGVAAMTPILKRAERLTASPHQLTTLQTGHAEPVFLVGLESAVLFCDRLQQQIDTSRRNASQATIEEIRIRLPTHSEWQYAARGVQTPAAVAESPHFNRWVRLQDLTPNARQKCLEVWSQLSRPGPFTGSQEDFLNLAATTAATDAAKVNEVLLECFAKAFGTAPRDAATGVGTIHPVGKSLPNSWQIFDMHDNVTEWVLAVSLERAPDRWQELVTKARSGESLTNQGGVFLAGGSFADSLFGARALDRFTVWGGPEMRENSNEATEDMVMSSEPGFRVILERSIRKDWLFALRSGLFNHRRLTPQAAAHLTRSQHLLNELAEPDHPAGNALRFYRALVAQSAHNTAESTRLFDQFVSTVSAPAPTRQKSFREAFEAQESATAAAPAPPPSENDDLLFWRAYQFAITTPE